MPVPVAAQAVVVVAQDNVGAFKVVLPAVSLVIVPTADRFVVGQMAGVVKPLMASPAAIQFVLPPLLAAVVVMVPLDFSTKKRINTRLRQLPIQVRQQHLPTLRNLLPLPLLKKQPGA
jgi:hypothetical protein